MRAIGIFEVVRLEWKAAKVVQVIIKSKMDGNLRLRVPNALKISSGRALKKATGQNPNPFYYTEVTPAPIISPKAQVRTPELKETYLYDLPAQKGQVYTLVAQ